MWRRSVSGSLIEDIRRLIADATDAPWLITERSSPGWRVEDQDGHLICYGPEDIHTADNGRLIALGRTYLEVLVSELEDRDTRIDALDAYVKLLEDENRTLRAIRDRLQELADSPLDGSTASEVAWALGDALTI
jgi:hypothetical protein